MHACWCAPTCACGLYMPIAAIQAPHPHLCHNLNSPPHPLTASAPPPLLPLQSFGNIGFYNEGEGNAGVSNIGQGNFGSENVGAGNTGTQNVGQVRRSAPLQGSPSGFATSANASANAWLPLILARVFHAALS